jgi:hypothetical protein
MAIQIFTGSLGLVLNRHYCQEELKSTAFFLQPPSCHEQEALKGHPPSCPMHASMGAGACEEKKEGDNNCCDNTSKWLKAEQEQQIPLQDLPKVHSSPALLPFCPASINPNTSFEPNLIAWLHYRPPMWRGPGDLPRWQRFLL